MAWGRYLMTFEHDHFEVIGFNPQVNNRHVVNLITDNIRVNEMKNENGGAEPYSSQ